MVARRNDDLFTTIVKPTVDTTVVADEVVALGNGYVFVFAFGPHG